MPERGFHLPDSAQSAVSNNFNLSELVWMADKNRHNTLTPPEPVGGNSQLPSVEISTNKPPARVADNHPANTPPKLSVPEFFQAARDNFSKYDPEHMGKISATNIYQSALHGDRVALGLNNNFNRISDISSIPESTDDLDKRIPPWDRGITFKDLKYLEDYSRMRQPDRFLYDEQMRVTNGAAATRMLQGGLMGFGAGTCISLSLMGPEMSKTKFAIALGSLFVLPAVAGGIGAYIGKCEAESYYKAKRDRLENAVKYIEDTLSKP